MDSVFGGLRVVDFSAGMAGPMAAGIMADYGAEVIKVERPGGDWARDLCGFHTWNRGKRSVVLDLAEPDDRDTAVALAVTADGGGVRPRAALADLVYRGIVLTFLTAECSDGRFVQMCARQDSHFRNWLTAIGLAHLLDEERYARAPMGFQSQADLEDMKAQIVARMKTKTQGEWMRIFAAEFDVGADPFLLPEEFLDHPQMMENDRVALIQDEDLGAVKEVGQLVEMPATPAEIARPAPRVGSDQQLLSGLARVQEVPTEAAPGPARLPLEGVTIVEFATFLAGPLAPALLAELGARVIKVEPLGGDSFRRTGLEFAHLGAGKESLAIDLKQPAAREVLGRILIRADAVIHNFRPAAARRLGLDYESLRAINPDLVYLFAGSYGSRGAQSERAAFHSTPNALSGGGIMQAGVGNAPVDDSYPDPCAGLGAAAALAMGLLARRRHGIAQALETTMLTSAGYVHSDAVTKYAGRPARLIPDGRQHGPSALYRLYECQDGWLFLAAPRDQDWARLAGLLGESLGGDAAAAFADRRSRRERDAELVTALSGIFATKSNVEWENTLGAIGVAAVRADDATFEEFLVNEKFVRPMRHADFGDYWGLFPRVRFPGADPRLGDPCGLGEHSRSLLTEFGFSGQEQQQMFDSGLVVERAAHE
jgi:crotonobetainyl-CoA:carnitine CoA-transferase CaiB-like acyl-CoA transferase